MGDDSSTRRPTAATMRSMMRRYCACDAKTTSLGSILPLRSIQTSSYALHMISVMVPSASRTSRGP